MKKLVNYVMDGLFGPCRKACDTPDQFCYCPHNPIRQELRKEAIESIRKTISRVKAELQSSIEARELREELREREGIYVFEGES